MKPPAYLLLSCLLFAGLGCLAAPTAGDGCAVASRENVRIAEEAAVIVWDAPSKTQHFIRRATFDTQAKDFGFLVPTPTQPKLAEVADDAFAFLEHLTRPRVVEVSGGFVLSPCLCGWPLGFLTEGCKVAKSPAEVRMLDAQRVGGFDAVVLEADDAQALNDWLKERGYPVDPELVSWLGPYISGRWKITAFKIAPAAPTDGSVRGQPVRSAAVRMSFQTDQPYFPYREPKARAGQPVTHPPRQLRVFFVGAGRTAGKRGTEEWAAAVPWADRLDDEQRAGLVKDLGVPAEHIPAGAWLTTFVDNSSPRPATDEIYFVPAAEQSAVRPPDVIRSGEPTWVPMEMIALAVAAVGFGVFCYRRRSRLRGPSGAAATT